MSISGLGAVVKALTQASAMARELSSGRTVFVGTEGGPLLLCENVKGFAQIVRRVRAGIPPSQ